MSYVKVTFKMEVSDEADFTGITEDEFNNLHEQVPALGGYDLEVERVDSD